MKAKVRIELEGAAYEAALEQEQLGWEEILETAVRLVKSHTQGVEEVDMADHLIRKYGIREETAKLLKKQLTSEQSQPSDVDEQPEAEPQKKAPQKSKTKK